MTKKKQNPLIKRWTSEEDDVIRSKYPAGGAEACRSLVGRSSEAIRSRAAKIGVRINERWDQQSIDYLVAHYPTSGKRHCMVVLGKTEAQIRQKAHDLGLLRDRGSEEYAAMIAEAGREHSKRLSGRSRPEQSDVMKGMWASGKFDTEAARVARLESGKQLGQLAKNSHPRGMLGKSHSETTKAVMSSSSKTRFASMTQDEREDLTMKQLKAKLAKHGSLAPPRAKATWRAGWREVGEQRCYFRSAWEANYARVLQLMMGRGEIICWEHEPETFWFEGIKRGCVSYLPDFRVTTQDGSIEYHEVKGWMDAASKTKIKRMAKYHPTITLLIIDKPKYMILQGQYRWQIEGWE